MSAVVSRYRRPKLISLTLTKQAIRMAPKLKLYIVPQSPPCRAVLVAAKALGLELELVEIDAMKKEQLTPEYIKLNPQHTVPTLVDGDKVLWDSHAINTYLAQKYAKDDSLYPRDVYQRSVVDQRLHMDSSVLFPLIQVIGKPIFLHGTQSTPEDVLARVKEVYGFLETFLQEKDWLVGDRTTLADIQCITTVTSLDHLVPVEAEVFPKVTKWIERCQKLPYYGPEQEGLEKFKAMIKFLLNRNT